MEKWSLPYLERSLEQAGRMTEAFLTYLKKNNARMNMSKTVGSVRVYDQLDLATGSNKFFTGTFTSTRSNMKNSFTRPEDEHQVITGIRFLQGTNPGSVDQTPWSEGATDAIVKNGNFSITTNGVVVQSKVPMTFFVDSLTTDDIGYCAFDEPIFWQGQNDLVIDLDLPAAPAASLAGRFELIGIGTLS